MIDTILQINRLNKFIDEVQKAVQTKNPNEDVCLSIGVELGAEEAKERNAQGAGVPPDGAQT